MEDMGRHAWHLIEASVAAAIGYMGTTAVAILVSIGAALLPLARAYRAGGFLAMRAHWRENLAWSAVTVTTIWASLLGVALVRTIYYDHIALVQKYESAEKTLVDRSKKRLVLTISGADVVPAVDNSTVVQLTITVYNPGEPTTLHDWQLVLHTKEQDFSAVHDFGEADLKGSLHLPRLDEKMQSPPRNECRDLWPNFVFYPIYQCGRRCPHTFERS